MTTPPSQRDYGHKDSSAPLVPGSLTVFRHFTVDTKRGVIQPMSVQPLSWVNSQRQMTIRKQGGDGMFGPYPTKYDPLTAGCNRTYLPATVPAEHKSPDPRCTCGFYASYDPATDFYPGVRWGDAWDRESYALPYGMETGFVIVRAAVEMSGTVVMGHRGVRAEKMKIKAIALDTSKWMSPLDAARSARREWWWFDADTIWPPEQRVSSLDDREVADLTEDGVQEMDQTRIAVARVAREYGVRFFGEDVEALERAYPKADVAALGVDTSPPPKPDYHPGGLVLSNSQVQLYSTATQQHGKSIIHDLMKTINDAIEADAKRARERRKVSDAAAGMLKGYRADHIIVDEAFDIDGFPKVETQYERLLREKRNRPAPPGTGIDRRRGKLR